MKRNVKVFLTQKHSGKDWQGKMIGDKWSLEGRIATMVFQLHKGLRSKMLAI